MLVGKTSHNFSFEQRLKPGQSSSELHSRFTRGGAKQTLSASVISNRGITSSDGQAASCNNERVQIFFFCINPGKTFVHLGCNRNPFRIQKEQFANVHTSLNQYISNVRVVFGWTKLWIIKRPIRSGSRSGTKSLQSWQGIDRWLDQNLGHCRDDD